MGWAIIFTIVAGVFYYLAKKKRDKTGAVRTMEGYTFAVTALLAVLLWIIKILGGFC